MEAPSLHLENKNSGEDGFPCIDWTATFAGRDAVMAERGERFD